MGSIYGDPEYEEMVRSVKIQIERVQAGMTDQQKDELELLLGSMSAQYTIENEHLFQAALGLARELNGLVRA